MAIVALVGGLVGSARADVATPTDPFLALATNLAGPVMFLRSGAPGMVLALVRGDQTMVVGYGETEKGNHREPDANSLIPVNSISKVFTTEVLANLTEQGVVRLTDTLQRYAGKTTVPRFDGHDITLLDLATYTGGLRSLEGTPPGVHPRAWPTRDDRWAALPTLGPMFAPGSSANYSNVEFDFLADALETASGQNYPALLDRFITGPLGMRDTVLAPTPEQCARRMIGSGLGGPADCVATQATGGSGGLYSTGHDMALWLRHNIAAVDGPLALSHAMYRPRASLRTAIGFDEGRPMVGLGLGWVFVDATGATPALITKSGAGVGFMNFVAFAPGKGVGVFVSVNSLDIEQFTELALSASGLIATITAP